MNKSRWTTRMLATAAVCIAMSFLLSYLKLFSMPTGGSITVVSMLPLMLFAWMYGVGPGMLAGAAYGLLQFIQKPEIFHWAQVVIDYPVAFMMLGLAGIFRKVDKPWALPAGVLIACFARFACHTFSGLIFFTDFSDVSLWGGLVASAIYNGGYMGVEAVISAVVAALPPVQHMLKRLKAM